MAQSSQQKTNKVSKRRHSVLCVIGLAALFSSLLIYSPAVIPFLRFDAFNVIVPFFVKELLRASVAFSLAEGVLAFFKKRLPFSILISLGGAAHISSSIIASLLSTSENVADTLVFGTALIAAFGCVALCLVWGRIYARFGMRDALIHVSLAGCGSVAVYSLIMALPPQTSTIVFLACAMIAVALSAIIGEAPQKSDEQESSPQKSTQTLRSLGSVLIGPIIGLMGFAFTMGSMREEFAHTYNLYLVALAVVSLVLLGYALNKKENLVLRGLHQTFIPLSAIMLLTILSITNSLNVGQDLAVFFIYLVYTFAAVITIASLCAIAHAEEFPSDLVFSVGVFLFALFSVIGQHCSELFASFGITIVISVITTLYAFAMILSTYLTRHREQDEQAKIVQGEGADSKTSISKISEDHRLTTRESEILAYLAQGHTGAYISEVLFISPNTTRTHIHNIYRKLDVNSREDILRITREDDS